jgi:hydroxypyruvate reductase
MAAAFEEAWTRAGGACEGLVVTRYGHGAPTRHVEIVEASHPVPDEAGLKAAGRILALAREAGPDDLVVCLMSGGASALLSLPAEGLTLADKQAVNRALLKSGAPIGEMNLVRKSLSAIKGGRLAAAIGGARLVTYLISDVPGDDPSSIGSGPTIPERVDPEVALSILKRYDIDAPAHVAQAIRANAIEGPVAGGAVHMLATPKMALDAAAAKAREFGLNPLILGDALEGEAREVGRVMAGIAHSALLHGDPVRAPCVLLSGGETTVTVRGQGARGAQCGVPAGPRPGPEGRARHLGHRLRYGRDRRVREQCGGLVRREPAGGGAAKGDRPGLLPCRQRCLYGVFPSRQACDDGADAHQRERFPLYPHPREVRNRM